ncbi:hypothetical protein M0804_013965 [Polistes exclamans]|nr:hypothetical protein M0804_013965 [Polistes exclamans]
METHATTVSGGVRAGHPPSSSVDCQELGVNNLAPALDLFIESASRVGDLACVAVNTPGRESSVVWRTQKRPRLMFGASPSTSEGQLMDFTGPARKVPTVPSTSSLETGRLLEKVREVVEIAEQDRKRSGNLKGDISSRIKHCHMEGSAPKGRNGQGV